MTQRMNPFNPLHKRNLGESVVRALLEREPEPLAALARFEGAGIYAIYYSGNFPAYELIARQDMSAMYRSPIYVGKAIPKGGRKGGELEDNPGFVLWGRLQEHAKSIADASNLLLDDFTCRCLVVDDIWIPLAESLLIAMLNPLWNSVIDGFGNHDPGKGRYAGFCPRWDVLHPGRVWAEKCKPRSESSEQIIGEAREFLRQHPPVSEHL